MVKQMETDECQSSSPLTANTDTADPQAADASTITEDAGVDEWVLEVPLKDVTYKVVIAAEGRTRLASLIHPKPKPDGNELEVLDNHKDSVENCWLLVLNWMNDCIEKHDKDKLTQGEQHATIEPHHWPLDGYDCSDGYLPLSYVCEALCDYIATILGRALAGRPLDWLSPTNSITAGDALTASFLAILDYYKLAEITPSLKNSGVGP